MHCLRVTQFPAVPLLNLSGVFIAAHARVSQRSAVGGRGMKTTLVPYMYDDNTDTASYAADNSHKMESARFVSISRHEAIQQCRSKLARQLK